MPRKSGRVCRQRYPYDAQAYLHVTLCERTRPRGQGRPGVRTPQRRPVAQVVIVQIQRLCQGGGGPAATQTRPLNKNSWRRPYLRVYKLIPGVVSLIPRTPDHTVGTVCRYPYDTRSAVTLCRAVQDASDSY